MSISESSSRVILFSSLTSLTSESRRRKYTNNLSIRQCGSFWAVVIFQIFDWHFVFMPLSDVLDSCCLVGFPFCIFYCLTFKGHGKALFFLSLFDIAEQCEVHNVKWRTDLKLFQSHVTGHVFILCAESRGQCACVTSLCFKNSQQFSDGLQNIMARTDYNFSFFMSHEWRSRQQYVGIMSTIMDEVLICKKGNQEEAKEYDPNAASVYKQSPKQDNLVLEGNVPIELSRILAAFLAALNWISLPSKFAENKNAKCHSWMPASSNRQEKIADMFSTEIKTIKEAALSLLWTWNQTWHDTRTAVNQHAKKVVSDSPGLVDFAIGLVNSVFNLPNRQVMSWGIRITEELWNQFFKSKRFWD